MELIWVKPTGSQGREEVSWFESTGVHVINDIYYPVTAGEERHFLLIWKPCACPASPVGPVGHRGWDLAWKWLKKTLAKVQGDMVFL